MEAEIMSIFFEGNVCWAREKCANLAKFQCQSHFNKGKVQRSTNPSLPPSVFFLNTTPATLKEHKNILGLPGLDPYFADMYASLVGTV